MTKTDKIVDSFLTGMVDLSGEKSKILCLHSDEKIQALKDKLNEALTIPVVVERLPIGEVITLIDNEDFKGSTGELKITGHCSYMGKDVGYLVNGQGIFLIEDFVR